MNNRTKYREFAKKLYKNRRAADREIGLKVNGLLKM